ncbi:hypothetical protein [Staphylococcus caeli]|uniref:hypothetical protein n=1 Tax=Staphylococcus caeli TaxID=2201815 RepID=UPI003F57421D
MANEPIIFMKDDNDVNFYPLVHIEGIQGWPENLSDLDIDSLKDEISSVSSGIAGIQSQINILQTAISSIPNITDTGWVDIQLKTGITAFTASETPQARLLSVNGVYFLSLRGAVKGATGRGTIASIPSSISSEIKNSIPFAQNTTFINNLANFIRLRIKTNGDIDLEGSTQNPILNSHWLPIDITIML